MAIVTVGSGGGLYGPTGGTMESPDFTGWNFAETLSDGSIVLRPAGPPASLFNFTAITLRGTGLSISPNDASGSGPVIGDRQVSGTITSFNFVAGTTASHGTTTSTYAITGISVPFSSLIANDADPLALILSGNDQISGSDYGDQLNGYAGDDVFFPGMSSRLGSIINGGTGNDTVNFSNIGGRLTIDLAAGTVTPIGVSGLENSPSTLISIENAVGSLSDDTLIGTAGNNVLNGGTGVDTISGGDGDDVILPGQAGRYPSPLYYDNVDGGAGQDTISFSDMTMAVTINLAAGTATLAQGVGAPPSTRMVSIENATGGSGNDIIVGTAGANTLTGGAGSDRLYSGAGDDILIGDTGRDRLYGEDGNDTLLGGSSNDYLFGGNGNDVLRGDGGADYIDGGAGIDLVLYNRSSAGVTVDLRWGTTSEGDTLVNVENVAGSIYDDTLVGDANANNLNGGAGNDTLWGFGGDDRIEGVTGNDNIYGGDGNDIIGGGDGNDAIRGEAGNDTLYGGNGSDQLLGGDGNDVIWADADNDYVDAGDGNDFVVLGAGNDGFQLGAGDDRVRFDYGNGNDTIFDFGNGRDVIDFTATDMTLAVLQANAVETGAGVLLNVGSGSILLSGIQLWQIEWNSDFVFAA